MAYSLVNSYSGESLLSGFDWFNGPDPSNGFVSYQNRGNAEAQGLCSVDEQTGIVRLGVDSTNTYGHDQGRPSIRLESKETYQHGLFIADFLHMPPSQCGVWPAFWSYGSDWPNGGEVDIIEGANTAHNNLISAHTSEGCVQDESLSGLFAGYQRNTDCYVGDHNVGCGFDPPSQAYGTYGDSFNAQSGGVYAMKWDEEHIKIWHFARGQIPTDIESRAPQPEGWGIPHAVFGGRECDVGQHFNNMRLVININFCGDYGNALWGKTDTCNYFASTCSDFVGGNPEAFANTYWDVRYIDAYSFDSSAEQKGEEKEKHHTTTTTATWFSTTTITAGNDISEFPVAPMPKITAEPFINPASIEEYVYLGCFGPAASGSSFVKFKESDDMTLEICVKHCRSEVGSYSGVCGRECFCGERIDLEMRVTSEENSQCNKPCPGRPGAFCGNGAGEEGRLLTVYGAVQEDLRPVPPPMAPPIAQDFVAEEYVATMGDCSRPAAGPRPAPAPTPRPLGPQSPEGPYEPQSPEGPYDPQSPEGPYKPQSPEGPYKPQSPEGPYKPQSPEGPHIPQGPSGPRVLPLPGGEVTGDGTYSPAVVTNRASPRQPSKLSVLIGGVIMCALMAM